MGWVYLDDSFPEHDKIIAAGGDAILVWIYGLAYCNRRLTEGRIPKAFVPQLTDRRKPMDLAAKLAAVGLWVDEGAHYRVHDYEKWNHSAIAKAKAKKGAAARWNGTKPDAQAHAQASAEHVPKHVPGPMPDAMLGDASRAPGPLFPSSPGVTSVDSSSSVVPVDEEEDWATIEAKRRLAARSSSTAVVDPAEWIRKVSAKIRATEEPPKPKLAVVRCGECSNGWLLDDGGVAVACPKCRAAS